jgi:cyclohexanecarboxyl-CoA dehydrogenase
MDFALSDDQKQLQEAARRFAVERLQPSYRQRELDGCFDRALVSAMGELGLITPDLPEIYGGMGIDGLTAGLIIEQVGYGDIIVGYIPMLGSLCGQILARHAPPDMAQDVLPRIARGETLVALGLTEPRGGTDAAHLILRARADGNGYVLDGEKASISMAAQADKVLVAARTGTEAEGAHGVSMFLVDLTAPGVTRSAYNDLGSKAVGRGSIWFDGVRVEAEQRVGAEGKGFTQVMQGFDYSRAMIALKCLGSAQASLDETWPYTVERQAFQRPIAQFQGVTFPLVEFDTQIQAARLLCYRTLWLRDQGLPHTAEAAMCKWWAPRLAVDTIHQCILTHGHLGYSMDLPHQQRLRDVMGLEIGDGTAQVSKMIVARERVGRVSVQYAWKK